MTGVRNGKMFAFLPKYRTLGSRLTLDKLPACVAVAVRHFCSIRVRWKPDKAFSRAGCHCNE